MAAGLAKAVAHVIVFILLITLAILMSKNKNTTYTEIAVLLSAIVLYIAIWAIPMIVGAGGYFADAREGELNNGSSVQTGTQRY